jgi:PAS domain S-box-containing protein
LSSVGKIEVEPGSGRFLRANAAMCKFVHYSEAELLGRSVYDITHPDDLTLDQELCRRLDAGESEFDAEKRYVRKDGRSRVGTHDGERYPRRFRAAIAPHGGDPGYRRPQAGGGGLESEQRSPSACPRCGPARVVAI